MAAKNYLLIALLMCLSAMCLGQNNDLDATHIKGRVKNIQQLHYYEGKQQEKLYPKFYDSLVYSNNGICAFSYKLDKDNGNEITESCSFDDHGRVIKRMRVQIHKKEHSYDTSTTIIKYDERGKEIESNTSELNGYTKFRSQYNYEEQGNKIGMVQYMNNHSQPFSIEKYSGDSLSTIINYDVNTGNVALKYVTKTVNGIKSVMRYEGNSLTETIISHKNAKLELDSTYDGNNNFKEIYSCTFDEHGNDLKIIRKKANGKITEDKMFVYSDMDKQGNYKKMEKYEHGKLIERVERNISYW